MSALLRRPAWLERLLAPTSAWCLRCRRPWTTAPAHTTDCGDRSCAALCESCWHELGTPEARLPYYRHLYEGWRDRDPRYILRENVVPWTDIQAAVNAGL